MDDQTINIPQLVLILLLGGFAVRYFFFSAPQTPDQSPGSSTGGIRVREADVDRVQQMFPQVARRTIMWDLQRNGGNIAATTERILSGRGLEMPPQSFQPPMPANATSPAPQPGSSTRTATPKPAQLDLISRYNLEAKIAASDENKETSGESSARKNSWSQNKTERQTLMQQRREEMILAARRKMEAKIAAENKLS